MNVFDVDFTINGICPYLKDRYWALLRLEVSSISKQEYENLLNIGFRKNGNTYYLPKCFNCDECKSLRVKTKEFKPHKRYRKLLRKNSDIKLKINKPTFTEKKIQLYKKYITIKHNDELDYDIEENYIYSFTEGIQNTQEMCYYLDSKLIAVGIIEVLLSSISSVYFYYDTDYLDRSLGIFSILKEIEYAQKLNKKYLHLGYYVHNCSAMNYKARFKPFDILFENSFWIDGEAFIKKFYQNKPIKKGKDIHSKNFDDLWLF
ncbi:MAG: arginyltransferase [bacterium]